MIGKKLGTYEVVGKLGEGGMGEVYRAHDSKLNRDVAIKVLPLALAADPAAVARFEREAEAIAALSHPHILGIHDFGRDAGIVYAVTELLEGQTLRERLAEGPLPVRKALEIARQIAQGLAAAHAKGIVHRDLKPENVFVTNSGNVKILDFGLAKAIAVHPMTDETALASRDASTPGMVVGTIGYMSPEQVTGAPVDQRTDIFAFGALLYEMLTGRRAFNRDSSAETIAAILREDVPELPASAGVPQSLERIVRRCVEKNPAERFHSAHDLDITLETLPISSSTTSHVAMSAALPPARGRTPPRAVIIASAIAASAIIALAAVLWSTRGLRNRVADHRVLKFNVAAQRLAFGRETRPAIAPDGEKIAFVAGDSLWIQELNQLDGRQLTASWRPERLFWSPDSAYVGYVSESKLWKVSINGGEPIALADVPAVGGGAGGTWRADGKIVFSRSTASGGLMEISQDGGEARQVAALQAGDVDFHEPAMLPGDSGVLLVVHRTEGPDTIAAIRGQTRKEILRLPGESLVFPQYASSGHVVFGRVGKATGIWALPFDPARLEATGEPFLVAAGGFWPTVSGNGSLTFIRRLWSEPRQLVVVNRAGVVERAVGEPQPGLGQPVVAPDGRRVAVRVGNPRHDVWIYDLQDSGRRRLTFLDNEVYPSAWTRGNRVAFSYEIPGRLRPVIGTQGVDGTGAPDTLGEGCCAAFSKDGTLIFERINDARESDADLYYRSPGDAAPKIFLERTGGQRSPTFSPDGAYVAYDSNESGRYEIYVRAFPAGAGQWQVSFNGGSDARWSDRGDKLWFRAYGNALKEVDVKSGDGTLMFGEPRDVFKGDPIALDLTLGFAVLANGDRFLAVRRMADPDGSMPSITVVQNWFAEVARKR